MPPAPEQGNPAPPPLSPTPVSPTSATVKAVRIFLVVLIVIGLGLIATYQLWVPQVVDMIVPSPTSSLVENVSQTTSTTTGGQATTASTTIDKFVSKDSTAVYWEKFSNSISENTVISGADPATFHAVSTPLTHSCPPNTPKDCPVYTVVYYADKNQVYVLVDDVEMAGEGNSLDVIPGADPSTFKVLNFNYAEDSKNVYGLLWANTTNYGYWYVVKPISSADVNTFQLVNGNSSYDATDSNHQYLQGQIVQ